MKTVTQHSENQYDDDLTVGMDDHDSFSTDSINLFEFTGDDDSPIARLKTIILSIDWEINDEILQQLKEELLDLNEIWAGDKIKQVYIQGLDKIGKYIFKERARSHPNAIKLLLTFYYNLEKIVSSEEIMSDEEKKKILLEDVKKFDQLKAQISKSSGSLSASKNVASQPAATGAKSENVLKTLKAQILGLDWEINDQGLQKLSEEVARLEEVFSQSKAKLILLQGIGALSSYIKKRRSQSNANAFSLLHSFYGALEKMIFSELSGDEEKTILFTEVAKFNEFKVEISKEKSESSPVKKARGAARDHGKPALATQGLGQRFQSNEDTAVPDQDEEASKVASAVESRLAAVFGDIDEEQSHSRTDKSALAGVNVETEADDDSDEEALPYEGGTIAPALADVEEESRFSVDSLAKELAASIESAAQQARAGEGVLPPGIDVETEADDDTEEEALPMKGGELTPALSGSEEDFSFDEYGQNEAVADTESADLVNRLDSFFGDEVEDSSDEWNLEEEPAPAFAEPAEPSATDNEVAEEVSAGLSFLDEEVPGPGFAEPAEPSATDIEVAEEVSAGLSFLDEEVPGPGFAEPAEPAATDNEVAEEVSAGLSFLDEEVPAPAFAEESPSEFIDEIDEQQVEEEEISFTLPGEEAPEPLLDAGVAEKNGDDDDGIEFIVPGEALVAEQSAFPAGLEQSEEVVFEVVADDVEVDSLPGEESVVLSPSDLVEEGEMAKFVEMDEEQPASAISVAEEEQLFEEYAPDMPSSSAIEDLAVEDESGFLSETDQENQVEEMPMVAAEQIETKTPSLALDEPTGIESGRPGSEENELATLRSCVDSLHGDITDEGLQSLLNEINFLRSKQGFDCTDKIFLQLLSTLCQHIRRFRSDSCLQSLQVLEKVFLGLEKSHSSASPAEQQTQQQLLECTSQVLLLQQRSLSRLIPEGIAETN